MDIFRRRKRNGLLIPLAALAIAGVGAGVWYYLQSRSSEQSSAPESAQVAAATLASESATRPAAETAQTPATSPTTAPVASASVEVGPSTEPATSPSAPAAVAPTTAPVAVAPATLPTFDPGTVMAEAQRLMSTGDLVAARATINPAVVTASLPPSELKLAMELEEQINKTLVFSQRKLPGDDFSENYQIKAGDTLLKIAPPYSITARFIQRINSIADPRRIRPGQSLKIVKGPFHAVVTKSTFQMDLYLGAPGGVGSTYICSLPVGLGRDDSTPAGTWLVEPGRKLVDPKYFPPRGGTPIEPGDPTNPLGKFWLGLKGTEGEAVGKASYGIHGTIEPDSIGKMSSMGCIRMRNDDIALVYEMLIEGKSYVVVKP